MKRAILVSFFFSSAVFAQSRPAWVTVRDTRENAFSIEVPKGWKTAGGMFRFRLVNPRPMVDMTSPDGAINLRVGDNAIPNYVSPGPLHPPGPGVAAYASGDVFATRYGQARFHEMCEDVQLIKAGPMPPKYSKPGQGPFRITAGAAGFSCTRGGQPMTGYVYAETSLLTGPLESPWYVIGLASFLAPAAQAETAGAMLKHAGESITFNPEWLRGEGERIRQATLFLHHVADATWRNGEEARAHFRQQMDMMRKESDYAQDVISGVTYTRDPWSGQTREVYTGSGANKWVNGRTGTVIDSTLSPGPSFHQLQPIDRP